MHAKQLGLLMAFALASSALAQQATVTAPEPKPMQPVARDANSCLWQGEVDVTNADGSIALAPNTYLELATGLNYFDATSGQWVPASEQINLLPNGGAIANQAQHQVQFPADIGAGDILLTMPDGTVLQTHPAGLAYFDGNKSVLIAQLTNSIGLLLGNTVTYTNCLVGPNFSASVRLTFTKAGLEQEVILADQPPDAPDAFGLDDSHSFLLVLTQFTNAPAPALATRQVTRAGLNADDDSVAWPSMSFGQGHSFLIGSNTPTVPSTKTWQNLDHAPYLIEQTPYTLLNQLWQALPKPQAALTPRRSLPIASLGLPRPPHRHLARANANAHPSSIKRLAQNAVPSGLSLDYIILNTSLTNYTFASSQTYYLSAPIYLYSSATFEPAVIKFTNNASITLASGLVLNDNCLPYAPLLLLSKDDNSAGANIVGSTANPTNKYANPALAFDVSSSLAHFRISCAKQAITVNGVDLTLTDGQIVDSQNGVSIDNATVALGNLLFGNIGCSLNNLENAVISGQNLTLDGGTNSPAYILSQNIGPYSVALTNSIVTDMTALTNGGNGTLTGSANGFYNCAGHTFGAGTSSSVAKPFEQAAAGNYYLTNGSAFKGAGLPLSGAALITGAPHRTTWPPILCTNTAFASSTRLVPIAPRQVITAPDLGYAYDALDYLASKVSGTALGFSNGVAVAFFGGYGIAPGGSGFVSRGLPQAMNHLCWYPSVQEQPVKLSGTSTTTSPLFAISGSSLNIIALSFTDLSLQGSLQNFFDNGNANYQPIVGIDNCTARALSFAIIPGSPFANGAPSSEISLENNLWVRSSFDLFNGYINYLGTIYQYPLGVYFYNNLFWSNSLTITYDDNQATSHPGWTINNNVFDTCAISCSGDGHWANYFAAGNNAYFQTPTNSMPAVNIHLLTAIAFDPGPLGEWYSDSNTLSSLINAGSGTAVAAGLAGSTLFTNTDFTGVAEIGDSNTVDIGFHYTVIAANGEPVGCEPVTNADTCLLSPYLTVSAISVLPPGSNSCAATLAKNNGLAEGIITLCDGTFQTVSNIVVPSSDLTILSNWVVVIWGNTTNTFLHTNAWKLTTTTNAGFGTNIFYTKYSDTSPCGGTFTNSYSNIFVIANWITPLANSGDDFGPGIDSSPALNSNQSVAYIESTGDMVYAIDVTSGTIITNRSLTTSGGEITSSPSVGPDGAIYFGSTDGFLESLSPNFVLNWSKLLGDTSNDVGVFATPSVTPDGTIYLGTDHALGLDYPLDNDTGFWSLRAANGLTNWFFLPLQISDDLANVESSAAIASDGTIYFLDENDRFYAMSPDANVKWFFPIEGHTEPDSSPSLGSDGTIYLGSDGPYLYALNSDGSIKWTFQTTNETDDQNLSTVIYSSPAVDSSGVAYFGIGYDYGGDLRASADSTNFVGILYAVSNGISVWAYRNGYGEIASSPALAADGTVVVGAGKYLNVGTPNLTTNGEILAVKNGALKWSLLLPSEVVSSPVITSNGTVVFGCEDGNVYAIPTALSPSTTAPWPMFRHDPRHTGCLSANTGVSPAAVPFPSDGIFDQMPPDQTQFSFSIVGPKNSRWSVYASTNFSILTTNPTLIGTVTIGPGGTNSFTNTALSGVNSKFYYLESNGFSSRVIGFIDFSLPTGSNMISDPFVQVSDADYATAYNALCPLNGVAKLFQTFGTTPDTPDGTVASGWGGQSIIAESNVANVWMPEGNILMDPGIGLIADNPAGASVQAVVGVTRRTVTNQISSGINYLGSGMPTTGGITSRLGLTNLSSGDMLTLWVSNISTVYTNTGGGWDPSEPQIGLCQGFILNCATSHIWVQTNYP